MICPACKPESLMIWTTLAPKAVVSKPFWHKRLQCKSYQRWGYKWVVVSVLVKLPFATRSWTLPILVALYHPPEGDGVQGARHQTPAHIVRLLLARLMRWVPDQHFIFVGNSGYGTSETGRFCQKHRQHLTLVSTCYGDAALYEHPPPRKRHTMGRPSEGDVWVNTGHDGWRPPSIPPGRGRP
jgi:hypothetical protein